MVRRRRFRSSGTYVVLSLVLLGAYGGCFPDFEVLSAGEDGASATSGSGGTSGAGDTGGTSGAGDTGGSGGAGGGGTEGSGNTESGGTSGAAGGGGDAGDMGTGGGGGAGTEGGACSTDLDIGKPEGDTVTDCGMCGLTCSLRNATLSICTDGACEPICRNGYDDCNAGTANDGCETAITSVMNCGACGVACSSQNVSAPSCNNGMCAPTCRTGFADCNASIANDGCETRLEASAMCRTSCEATPVACAATEVCHSGTCGAATGLTVLTVPLTASGQLQRYAAAYPMGSYPDLTGAIVTIRLYAPGATGGELNMYLLSAPDYTYGGQGAAVPLTTLAAGWTEVTVSAGVAAPPYNPSTIIQLNFDVGSGSSASWTNPTVIYIDLITSSNGRLEERFDTIVVPPMTQSGTDSVPGATLTWSDTVP
jgi:hypothetical protein